MKFLNYKVLKRKKQPLKKVFWKIVVGILKENSQLFAIWAKSMENTSKEVDFSKVAGFFYHMRKMFQKQIQNFITHLR